MGLFKPADTFACMTGAEDRGCTVDGVMPTLKEAAVANGRDVVVERLGN
jgi:hypothetical protein